MKAEQEKAGQADKQWQGRLQEVQQQWQTKLSQGQLQWAQEKAAAEQAWREAKQQAEQLWKQQLESISHAHRYNTLSLGSLDNSRLSSCKSILQLGLHFRSTQS